MSIELYTPTPGGVPWRVIDFLINNPDEELTRGDIAVKFDCVGGGLDTALKVAVMHGILKRARNEDQEIVWMLGDKTQCKMLPWTPPPAATGTLGAWGAGLAVPAGLPEIRKDTPLTPALSPKARRKQELLDWLAAFEVNSSAEFPSDKLKEFKGAGMAYARRHKGVKFSIRPTRTGFHGIERKA